MSVALIGRRQMSKKQGPSFRVTDLELQRLTKVNCVTSRAPPARVTVLDLERISWRIHETTP
jgi:hypothetical protein